MHRRTKNGPPQATSECQATCKRLHSHERALGTKLTSSQAQSETPQARQVEHATGSAGWPQPTRNEGPGYSPSGGSVKDAAEENEAQSITMARRWRGAAIPTPRERPQRIRRAGPLRNPGGRLGQPGARAGAGRPPNVLEASGELRASDTV